MVLTAHRVRTSLALAGATGTIIAALLLHARRGPVDRFHPDDVCDDGMCVDARLTSSQILSGTMNHDVAITITAPKGRTESRPPLSLAVVIDRSGSMAGEPLANAKAAASRLIAQLDGADAFAIVTYSSGDETVMPMSRATEANKAAARYAIANIVEEGGTCISCGLTRGTNELARTPIARGLSRIVLISDGQANEGVYDRGELAELAGRIAAGGMSISSVGVGLDFDEVTMNQLANVGHGNYYFVEDTANLDAMFARELGGLTETIAADAHLVLTDGPGARIEEAYGYPIMRTGDHVVIPVADIRAGETRKVVIRVHLAPVRTGPMTVTQVELGWRRVSDGAFRHATTGARVSIVDDPAAVAASFDPNAIESVEQALSARALEEASDVLETHGADAAQQVIQLRAATIRANKNLSPAIVDKLEKANVEALDNFKNAAPTKAKKVSRVRAYELAH
jgi:Ca-activated chloride channel family protein